MKLDLIIPAYNNKLGLYRSLLSLGTDNHEFIEVTVVDDASDDDYSSIIEFFQQFVPIRLLKLPKNVGPGLARQYGLDHTFNPYVMFLDCGDYYCTPDKISMIYQTIQEHPTVKEFRWGHTINLTRDIGCQHNRMHGKVYMRSFLNQHNIRFNPHGSYANEDIGFNMIVKMILAQEILTTDVDLIYESNESVITWDNRDPSITRANNTAFYFSIQNEALATNGGYALAIAQREHVSMPIILHQTYEIMCDMYFKYLSTTSIREEFTEQALMGAAHFYWEHFRPISEHNMNDLIEMYYNTLVQYLSDKSDPIRCKFTTLDFIGFLQLLEEVGSKKYT